MVLRDGGRVQHARPFARTGAARCRRHSAGADDRAGGISNNMPRAGSIVGHRHHSAVDKVVGGRCSAWCG